MDRAISTVNDTKHRSRSDRTVADRIRALPAASFRSSLRVDSCVLITPRRGRATCPRSGSRRMVPVVNLTEAPALCFVSNLGKPMLRPARLPRREASQFFKARASWSSPVLNTSFEHSRHQGAASSFARFQALRNAGRDQPRGGVSASPPIPYERSASR